VKIGRNWYIAKEEIDRYLESIEKKRQKAS
jgi:hypothetical protein